MQISCFHTARRIGYTQFQTSEHIDTRFADGQEHPGPPPHHIEKMCTPLFDVQIGRTRRHPVTVPRRPRRTTRPSFQRAPLASERFWKRHAHTAALSRHSGRSVYIPLFCWFSRVRKPCFAQHSSAPLVAEGSEHHATARSAPAHNTARTIHPSKTCFEQYIRNSNASPAKELGDHWSGQHGARTNCQ